MATDVRRVYYVCLCRGLRLLKQNRIFLVRRATVSSASILFVAIIPKRFQRITPQFESGWMQLSRLRAVQVAARSREIPRYHGKLHN